MMQNVKGEKKVTGIDYLAAILFSRLSSVIQDELLSVMREMVADNKAK